MQVADIMTRRVESITEEDNVALAAQMMRDLNVGALPVRNNENKMTGMITDRDIVVRAIADGKQPNSTQIRMAMTDGVVSCPAEQSVEEAVALMEQHQIRRLVVLNESNQAVGILALGDVAVKAPGKELCGEAMEEISKPGQPSA
jgi:CBS domain-containing protein